MIFQNHEIVKIIDPSPVSSSILIYIGLAALAVWRIEKTKEPIFLGKDVTQQIRGLAILLVLVGHIGIHALASSNGFLMGGDFGVSVFFVLSGFGLTRSYSSRKLVPRIFFMRRMTRVMIPYWTSTLIIVSFDHFLLGKYYSTQELLQTVAGINITKATRHIDYVRWYITILIIWYLLFAFLWQEKKQKALVVRTTVAGCVLFLVNYYLIPFGYAIFSFPFGVFLGVFYDELRNLFYKVPSRSWGLLAFPGCFAPFILSKLLFPPLEVFLPSIGLAMANEILWMWFCTSVMIIFSLYMGRESTFFRLLGKYSFEIFLFHGVLMIKYDFLLFRGPIFLTFWPYLCFVLLISTLMHRNVFDRVRIWLSAE